jgi:hypothetical protein
VGLFPYVLRLLQSTGTRELREVLVFIWAKVLSYDGTCQADLIKQDYYQYFLLHLLKYKPKPRPPSRSASLPSTPSSTSLPFGGDGGSLSQHNSPLFLPTPTSSAIALNGPLPPLDDDDLDPNDPASTFVFMKPTAEYNSAIAAQVAAVAASQAAANTPGSSNHMRRLSKADQNSSSTTSLATLANGIASILSPGLASRALLHTSTSVNGNGHFESKQFPRVNSAPSLVVSPPGLSSAVNARLLAATNTSGTLLPPHVSMTRNAVIATQPAAPSSRTIIQTNNVAAVSTLAPPPPLTVTRGTSGAYDDGSAVIPSSSPTNGMTNGTRDGERTTSQREDGETSFEDDEAAAEGDAVSDTTEPLPQPSPPQASPPSTMTTVPTSSPSGVVVRQQPKVERKRVIMPSSFERKKQPQLREQYQQPQQASTILQAAQQAATNAAPQSALPSESKEPIPQRPSTAPSSSSTSGSGSGGGDGEGGENGGEEEEMMMEEKDNSSWVDDDAEIPHDHIHYRTQMARRSLQSLPLQQALAAFILASIANGHIKGQHCLLGSNVGGFKVYSQLLSSREPLLRRFT